MFDYFESLIGTSIDRDAFCDTMVRMQLSTLIIPATPEWLAIWNSTPDRLSEWALQIANSQTDHKKG